MMPMTNAEFLKRAARELEILRQLYSLHWSIAERNDPGDRPFGPQRLWIFRPKG